MPDNNNNKEGNVHDKISSWIISTAIDVLTIVVGMIILSSIVR